MNTPKKALLFVGSPRAQSTSAALGGHLLGRLKERRFATEVLHITPALRSKDGTAALLSAVESADVVVLATPLYVDSLPGPVVRAFELLADSRRSTGNRRGQWFLPIINCGFPESRHNDTALAQCRLFCRGAGMEWAGGLGLGGGGAIGGRPLNKRGWPARHVIASLELAASALAEGRPVPHEAVDLMARPVVPLWLYMLVGHTGWRSQAKKFKARERLHDRPYRPAEDPHPIPDLPQW